jgi:GDP-4-dehydro-6-deoxy-D-mannose reductase
MNSYNSIMKILIIGDTGFVAGHVLPALKKEFPEARLYGMSNQSAKHSNSLLVQHFVEDIVSEDKVAKIIESVLPDIVINLSSISSVFESWTNPIVCHQINYMGVLNLCLAITKYVPEARLIHISSMEIYGGSKNPNICYDESSPVNPQSPYAVSKLASEFIIRQYGISHNLHYTILRPANHTGPGRKASFVLSGFARQLAEIKLGLHKPILYTGNLNIYKDFLDVRDVIRAYIMILKSDQADQETFNVCSGNVYSLQELLNYMIGSIGVDVEIKVDPRRFRPVDAAYLKGNNLKIRNVIGWEPKIPIEKTLLDLLDFWEKQLSS